MRYNKRVLLNRVWRMERIGLGAEMSFEYTSLRRHEGTDERLCGNFLRIGFAYSPCGYSCLVILHAQKRFRAKGKFHMKLHHSSFIEYPAGGGVGRGR